MEIAEKYKKANRLYGAIYEVTHRCMCSCVHCLLVKPTDNELSVHEIGDLLSQLRAEGAFELGHTGGEVFLRTRPATDIGTGP